jgi:catechol 2,3-dioxygenase-like lactoylglutathione lyase family enzyme
MFTRKEEIKSHVPARVRAYGRARIEIAQRAQTAQDWNELWKPPTQPFAFEWGEYWKHCIEYKVKDFTAEVGFFIDLLGLPVNAFNENYAMFTSPDREFFLAVVPAGNGKATPPDALRVQFMVADIFKTTAELQKRGIHFAQEPQPVSSGSNQWVVSFQTPNGICMEIWGYVAAEMVETGQRIQPGLENNAWSEASVEETDSVVGLEQPESIGSFSLHQPDTNEGESDQDEYDWSISEDLEDDIDDEEPNAIAPVYNETDEGESDSQPLALNNNPKRPERPMPVRSFQSAEEMLEHLKQKKLHSKPASLPLSRVQQSAEKSKGDFSPAPKKTAAKKPDSVWDMVKANEEYVDMDEAAAEDYHYRPIPLTRKE